MIIDLATPFCTALQSPPSITHLRSDGTGLHMIICRIIGGILVLAALAAAGYEAFSALGPGGWRPIALGEIWFKIHPASLNAAQAGIQRHIAPWLWEPVITTVLLWPGWAVFGVPGVALLWLCRGRHRRRHRRG